MNSGYIIALGLFIIGAGFIASNVHVMGLAIAFMGTIIAVIVDLRR